MNGKKRILIVTVLLLLFAGSYSEAGSIWAKRDKNMRNLYVDDVARQIGDILTIIISEDSTVDNKAKRDLNKDTTRTSSFNGELNIDHLLPKIPGLTMSATTANKLTGKSDYKDERLFEDMITVVVEDILPNGNLIVIGTRHRDIAGDTHVVEVSGIVRPSDIAFDNTIKSEKVGNFRIVSKNSGISASYGKPGWLGRIMDTVWPF